MAQRRRRWVDSAGLIDAGERRYSYSVTRKVTIRRASLCIEDGSHWVTTTQSLPPRSLISETPKKWLNRLTKVVPRCVII